MGYLRMRRELGGRPVDIAPLPAGIALLPFSQDNARAGRELMQRTYADLNDGGISFDGWWTWLTTDPEFDSSLIWIAGADDQVVGFCHCWAGNFVKDLVVDRAWQRRGLGGALLTRALAKFAAGGAGYVDLKTDIDNEKAQSLYRRLGFTVVERVD